MTTVFDELYFGASLFEKIHGVSVERPAHQGAHRARADTRRQEDPGFARGDARRRRGSRWSPGGPTSGPSTRWGRTHALLRQGRVDVHRRRRHRPGPPGGIRRIQEAEPRGPRQGAREALLGDAPLRGRLGRGPDDGPEREAAGGSRASCSRGSTRRRRCAQTRRPSSRGRAPTSSPRP